MSKLGIIVDVDDPARRAGAYCFSETCAIDHGRATFILVQRRKVNAMLHAIGDQWVAANRLYHRLGYEMKLLRCRRTNGSSIRYQALRLIQSTGSAFRLMVDNCLCTFLFACITCACSRFTASLRSNARLIIYLLSNTCPVIGLLSSIRFTAPQCSRAVAHTLAAALICAKTPLILFGKSRNLDLIRTCLQGQFHLFLRFPLQIYAPLSGVQGDLLELFVCPILQRFKINRIAMIQCISVMRSDIGSRHGERRQYQG